MISVKIDMSMFNKKMNEAISYSNGFMNGVQMERLNFMRFLGGFVAEGLNKYIDSRARANPNALHHVYEPNMVGSENGRLFKIAVVATPTTINFTGAFLSSKKPSDTSREPFADKANIMENAIAITIEPRFADVLVFEGDDGDLVFTTKTIHIEHPGGDEVAGSFGRVVEEFFTQYLTNALLRPLIADLETAEEFVQGFGGNRMAGVRAGRRYLSVSGLEIK